jgi:hypothetical protein
MRDPVPPADLSKVRTHPLAERESKVRVEQFGRPLGPGATLRDFLDSLPSVLAADTLRALASEIAGARASGKPVVLGCGAHVIKVGVSPVVVRLMEEGIVTALAMNGAGAIHDWEVAAVGTTSEDVSAELGRARFGTADETGREIAAAALEAVERGEGFGFTLGRRIVESERPHREVSLLGRAYELGVPVTVHVALGADVVHQHPAVRGAALGEASHLDFRKLVTILSGIAGGVYVNCGSAVQLPEVFLKALAAATNLGFPPDGLVTANLDMTRHYRTGENVLRRPTAGGGRSFELIGHHEINLPLLAAAIEIERARRKESR